MKRVILRCTVLALLLVSVLLNVCFFATYVKGRINGRNTSNFSVADTVYIHDTVKIIAPTPTSETFLWYDTVALERADKGGKNEKLEKRSESKDSARLINEVSKVAPDTNAVTKTAIGDSVAVIVPISEKVYDDSLYRAVVRGYQAELVSLDIYQKHTYYPVVVEKEYDPPNIVVSIGPYVGFGNKGFNYGIALTVGVPIELKWPW